MFWQIDKLRICQIEKIFILVVEKIRNWEIDNLFWTEEIGKLRNYEIEKFDNL